VAGVNTELRNGINDILDWQFSHLWPCFLVVNQRDIVSACIR
jgi:hypothetical protein